MPDDILAMPDDMELLLHRAVGALKLLNPAAEPP